MSHDWQGERGRRSVEWRTAGADGRLGWEHRGKRAARGQGSSQRVEMSEWCTGGSEVGWRSRSSLEVKRLKN